jgi:hypothetical protein
LKGLFVLNAAALLHALLLSARGRRERNPAFSSPIKATYCAVMKRLMRLREGSTFTKVNKSKLGYCIAEKGSELYSGGASTATPTQSLAV